MSTYKGRRNFSKYNYKKNDISPYKRKRRNTVDAFYNPSSGFGGQYDPINRLVYNIETLPGMSDVETLYRQDWTTRKIIETIPNDAIRKWIDFQTEDDDIVRDINNKMKILKCQTKIKRAMINARLYGAGIIIIGAIGSGSPETPLDYNKIDDILFLNVLDRYSLQVHSYYKDVFSNKYGEPEFYTLNTQFRSENSEFNKKIHESRVLKFDGSYLPERIRIINNGWHDSKINSINLILKQFGTSIQAGAILFQDFITKVLKMPNLSELLTTDEGRSKLDLRIQYVLANMSSIGITLIGEDEEYNKMNTPITGLADLMDKYIELISAASDIPRARLFGQALGTLAGASETTRTYYDYIRGYQIDHMMEPLINLIKILLNSKSCITKGNEPDKWGFYFNSLWDHTDKEMTTARKMQMQIDVGYIEKKVVTPDEVARCRFGPGGYSFDTNIDIKNRYGKFWVEPKIQQPINNIEENINNKE